MFDDPNREAVGLEPAWVEGTGGSSGGDEEVEPTAAAFEGTPTGEQLDAMTKDELLAYAQQIGVSPANAAMAKAEIRAGVDAKLAEG